jgi:hypothetical protein
VATTRGRTRTAARALTFTLAPALVLAALVPAARADEETLVRVIAEEAAVRTGPGFAYRIIYVGRRDDVFPAIDRSSRSHWLRVRLPDGTSGWLLGDQVFPMDLDTAEAHRGPSIWRRIGDALFSPSPLLEGRFSLTFSAGLVGRDSAFIFRPAVLFEPHVSVEGFVGETVGNQVDVIYYGGGPNIYVFPTSPVTPFLGAAIGGATTRPKADVFGIDGTTYAMINAGGGLSIALKKRVTLRGDARHYVVFSPNHTHRLEEYTGALNITF